ncbi:methylated-DNA--[protein]-cysteine S-methyltransferase [Chloroflexota bacterium]
MIREQYYVIFNTAAGWVGILRSTAGLMRTTLPQQSDRKVRQLLGDGISQATWSPRLFQDLTERFRIYFAGHMAFFPDELDLSGATSFQREVWEITRLIPCGETRSYGWVAGQLKKPGAARAVGQALGRNPLPVIVPCHRVLAGNGQLGGFSGGIEMKRSLLSLEGSFNN